jgi:hypothetical protein
MARSKLTSTTDDLVSDGGSVLFSFVQGEQLEHPITLNFIDDANNYEYEAVIVEALNVADQTSNPLLIKVGGVQTTLYVRVPLYRGAWSSVAAYNAGELILYQNIYYILLDGSNRTNSTLPTSDPYWQVTTKNKVYVQFPKTMSLNWEIQPKVNYSVYGFFELRVTELSGVFPRTWKPVRGLVEVLFSPTELVV